MQNLIEVINKPNPPIKVTIVSHENKVDLKFEKNFEIVVKGHNASREAHPELRAKDEEQDLIIEQKADKIELPNNLSDLNNDEAFVNETQLSEGLGFKQDKIDPMLATTNKNITGAINEIDSSLSQKASIDCDNISNNAKNVISSFNMPSTRRIDLTLGANMSTYTAPANGYLWLNKAASATNQYARLYNNKGYAVQGVAPVSPMTVDLFLPVAKNSITTLEYNLAGATNYFRFIYTEGAI